MTARPFATAVIALLFAAAPALAQSDHLQCFKIKDSTAKTTYHADLIPADNAFAVAPGCSVKVPAKLLCIDVDKVNVTPTPPGSPAGAPAQKYLCYKVKCPKPQVTTSVQDQFGTHPVILKTSSLLCAPEPAPTTTTTMPCPNFNNDGDGFFAPPCGQDCDDNDPSVFPGATEVCNNVDDDCNSMIDDGLGQTSCGTGQCQNTVQNCVAGNPQSCSPGAPSAEVCDNVDNNCNGMVDDGLGQTTCGTGACQNTVQNCIMGNPQMCNPGPSSSEQCGNAIDDDCDGQVDEQPCICLTAAQCPSPPNATGQCVATQCTFFCAMGYGDCNLNSVDGCEVFTQTDPNNCGTCNAMCPIATPNCVNGACQ